MDTISRGNKVNFQDVIYYILVLDTNIFDIDWLLLMSILYF